jgi:hypothetical protein
MMGFLRVLAALLQGRSAFRCIPVTIFSVFVLVALSLSASQVEAGGPGGPPEWEDVTPSPAGPTTRFQHAMAFDPSRNRVVLFGGFAGTARGDTWEWDGSVWTKVSQSGPSPRYWHAMAYDEMNQRVVLFGGYNGTTRMGDTWLWDGTSWAEQAVAGPSSRYLHAMAWGGPDQGVVLFGGFDTVNRDDTWTWDGSAWTLHDPDNAPSARNSHAMAVMPLPTGGGEDLVRGNGPQQDYHVVLFGGYNGVRQGDTWVWDGTDWTHVSDTGPSARTSHSMSHMTNLGIVRGNGPNESAVLLFGGFNTTHRGDTWLWDGDEWIHITDDGPGARRSQAMVYDNNANRVVLFGGYDGARKNDTWIFRYPPLIPTGACCESDDSCTDDVTEIDCTSGGGDWAGEDVLCEDITCPLPRGACCESDDSCTDDVNEFECTGEWAGENVLCEDITCPLPRGACCESDDSCTDDVTEAACTGGGGTWAGDGVLCESVTCPLPTCTLPGDMNDDAVVNGDDIQAFVDCAIAGSVSGDCACADMNDDSAFGEEDIDTFIAVLLAIP